ncbi:hypothetical protein [Ralstonia pseudosolanacearum]|uniref:hypothetical protein n=1 Tax=Ralstonia pseudosolanacearum TaxID=1310165 RepID=UPI0009BCA08A|nr:hypothetical protein [Ralstonia pseudosolanacearum]
MDNTTGRRANRFKTPIAKRMRGGNEDFATHPERSGNAALIASRFQRPYGERKNQGNAFQQRHRANMDCAA